MWGGSASSSEKRYTHAALTFKVDLKFIDIDTDWVFVGGVTTFHLGFGSPLWIPRVTQTTAYA